MKPKATKKAALIRWLDGVEQYQERMRQIDEENERPLREQEENMSAFVNDKEQDKLEALIDSKGLSAVLDSIETICILKAQQLQENLQATTQYHAWLRAQTAILDCNQRIVDIDSVLFTKGIFNAL